MTRKQNLKKCSRQISVMSKKFNVNLIRRVSCVCFNGFDDHRNPFWKLYTFLLSMRLDNERAF